MKTWFPYLAVAAIALVAGFFLGRSLRSSGTVPPVLAVGCDAGVNTSVAVACDAGAVATASCDAGVLIRWVDRIIYLPGDAGVVYIEVPVVTATTSSTVTAGAGSAAAGSADAGALASATGSDRPVAGSKAYLWAFDGMVAFQPAKGWSPVLAGKLDFTPGDLRVGVWGAVPFTDPGANWMVGVSAGGRF